LDPVRGRLQGILVWAAALAAAWFLPGSLWRPLPPPPFPLRALAPAALALGLLALAALGLVRAWGPAAARSPMLRAWEAVPDLLWGVLFLALRPASWGPPGAWTWVLALLAAALPGEVRWLAQALPREHPFPAAWGPAAAVPWREGALRRLAGGWLAARLPVWLTATLVLERLLNVRGLGTDWAERLATRDHAGLSLWILALAALWTATAPRPGARR
jgi:hypothetical protein